MKGQKEISSVIYIFAIEKLYQNFMANLYSLLDDESRTSANLGNDPEFINKIYSLHWNVAFWGS